MRGVWPPGVQRRGEIHRAGERRQRQEDTPGVSRKERSLAQVKSLAFDKGRNDSSMLPGGKEEHTGTTTGRWEHVETLFCFSVECCALK